MALLGMILKRSFRPFHRGAPILLLLVFAVGALSGCRETARPFTISAASSLRHVMPTLVEAFAEASGVPPESIVLNVGGSGTLAQQIRHGAPVDLFLSAHPHHTDALVADEVLTEVQSFASNSLVVIVPATDAKIADWRTAHFARVAIGAPKSVPVGRYAREALTTAGLWRTWQDRIVFAKNAEQVVAFVGSRNADAGIVYATDAARSAQVRVVVSLPDGGHATVEYLVGRAARETQHVETSQDFIHFLLAEEAQEILQEAGFKRTE